MGKPKKYQEVFYFNKKERLGLLLLSALVVTTSLLRIYWQNNQTPESSITWEILPTEKIDSSILTKTPNRELENFDPNTVHKELLLAYGIPEKAVKNWIRYREKGGQFRKAKDVEKIYSLPTKTFHRIKPFLRFPNPQKKSTPRPIFASKESSAPDKRLQPFPFDPNQIELQALEQLGLPTKTAKQIIRYRESGGRFRDKSDLKKIYTITNAEYTILEPFIQIKKSEKTSRKRTYQVISINTQRIEDWKQFRGIGPSLSP